MGWFGFGGSRTRDERTRENATVDQSERYEAVVIDRRGKPSALPDYRPRRRDFQDRRGRG